MSNQQVQPQRTGELRLGSQRVSFRDLGQVSKLALDYLYQFEELTPFYAHVKPQPEALAAFAPTIMEQEYRRELLIEVLLEQNRRFGSSPDTLENIRRLGDSKTVAIVTGQQAGLFTGPLYTILKALTAVQMSRDLCAEGIRAVPIFWIECEDHDQAEVNHCYVVDSEGQRQKIEYAIDPGETGKSVSQVVLTEAITQTVDEAISLLPRSEFMPDIERQMRVAYTPGVGLADGFARLMAQWFQGLGLVLLNPTDLRLKQSLTALFEKSIRGASEVADLLAGQTRRLTEAGYKPQLRITDGMVPFFVIHQGKRVGLTTRHSHFALKSGDESYSIDDLLDMAHNHPEQLSPGVALRPLVQDTLLPTLAYIGGQSEIAYFGQLKSLYQWVGRPMTPVLPRAFATLLERRYAKTLNKYNLQFVDLFKGIDAVRRTLVETNLASQTANLFDATELSFRTQLEEIANALAGVDPNLRRAAKTAQDKIVYQLTHLRTRFSDAQARKDEATLRQTERAINILYPGGRLQERQLNILHFLSRYGPQLLPALLDALDVWHPGHQVISLP